MTKGHKRIFWAIAVLLSAVGPYCFPQSQTYSASGLECNPPGSSYLYPAGAAAPSAVLGTCHSEVNSGSDGSHEISDGFVRDVEIVNERVVGQGSRGNLTEAEEILREPGMPSGRRSWREIIINW